MAMMDYGAIGFKNGKLISTDWFTPMEKTVGYSDFNENNRCGFDKNYFLVIGNKKALFGFYKNGISYHAEWYDEDDKDNYIQNETIWFDPSTYHKWKYWSDFIVSESKIEIKVKPLDRHYDSFVADIVIDDDKYQVYFGYGIDLEYYKKTGKMNYYKSIKYKMSRLKRKIKLWLNLRFGIEFKN